MESKEQREREVNEFECFICELNKYIKSKSTQSAEQYMSVKNEVSLIIGNYSVILIQIIFAFHF